MRRAEITLRELYGMTIGLVIGFLFGLYEIAADVEWGVSLRPSQSSVCPGWLDGRRSQEFLGIPFLNHDGTLACFGFQWLQVYSTDRLVGESTHG